MPMFIGLKNFYIEWLHAVCEMWYRWIGTNTILIGKNYELRGKMTSMIIHKHKLPICFLFDPAIQITLDPEVVYWQ